LIRKGVEGMDKKKILIVDDEEDILKVLGLRLSKAGYSVLKANNGKDALIMAKNEHPDLIVLDIMMPIMGGNEIAAELKEDPQTKDIPIMFLTSLFTREEERGRGHGIADNVLFAKPYNPQELLEEVKKQLAAKDQN
jgi:CheY-like chemotaxis protein